jgi:hypothetical protein
MSVPSGFLPTTLVVATFPQLSKVALVVTRIVELAGSVIV